MSTLMLGAALGMYDLGGLWSLTLIISLVTIGIILAVTRNGFAAGFICCVIWCLFCFLFMDKWDGYIANKNQTKWKAFKTCGLSGNSIYIIHESVGENDEDEVCYIPDDEIVIIGQWKCMKSTGRPPTDNAEGNYDQASIDENYYDYDKVYSNPDIPVWLYHPAAVFYPFVVFGGGLMIATMIYLGKN